MYADSSNGERDSQRSKVYTAERDAGVGAIRRETVESCQAYIDRVLNRARVVKRYGKRTAEARPGFGHRNAEAGGAGLRRPAPIQLPRWARHDLVILHELAHVLTWGEGASHGWQVAECFLFLVREMCGVDAAAKLEAAFKARKVRYRKPRRGRTPTPEQREAMVARLAAYRESSSLSPQRARVG